MTQDQYGQPRGPGYVTRGDAVPDSEAEETTEQPKPMTRFQKVASALLGDRQDDRDEAAQDQAAQDQAAQDQAAQDQGTPGNRVTTGSQAATDSDVMTPGSGAQGSSPAWTPVSNADEAAAASSPAQDAPVIPPDMPTAGSPATAGDPRRDYLDDPSEPTTGRNEPAGVTNPDVRLTGTGADPLTRGDEMAGQAGTDAEGYAATQPDLYGTTRAGNVATQVRAENAPGAATIADAPAADAAPGTTDATAGTTERGTRAAGTAGATPGTTDAAAGTTGRAGTAGAAPGTADAASTAGATSETMAGSTTGMATGTMAGSATDVAGTAGRHAAAPADAESRPGALGDFSDLTYGNLVPDADQLIAQWQQIQFRFVDDPHGSVTEAADVVAQVTAKLEAAIQERQRAIEERQRAIQEQQRSLRGRWGDGTNADTEVLRETLRMYHTFLEQLIGSTGAGR